MAPCLTACNVSIKYHVFINHTYSVLTRNPRRWHMFPSESYAAGYQQAITWLITMNDSMVWCHKQSNLKQCSLTESWWRHQMETFSALLAICAVTGEFPAQRPETRNIDVFFDLRLNKRLSKQSWGWWFETPSRSLWRHCNIMFIRHWGLNKNVIRHFADHIYKCISL